MRPFLIAGLKNNDLANFIRGAKMTYIIGDNTTEDMRMLHSDAIILFEKEGFRPFSFIVIAEHKANIGKGDVLQLAKYTILELDKQFKNNGCPVPPVIPFLLSHAISPRDEKKNLIDLHEKDLPPFISRYVLDFDYEVLDLKKLDPKLLGDDPELLLVFYTMRDIHEAKLGESLCSSLNYLSRCSKGKGLTDEVKDTLKYTIQYVNKSENVNADDVVDMLYKLDDGEVKDTVLTLEKQIERKGFNEGEKVGFGKGEKVGFGKGREDGIRIGKADGIKIGREDEKIAIARNLKHGSNMTIDEIAKFTGLTQAEIEAI